MSKYVHSGELWVDAAAVWKDRAGPEAEFLLSRDQLVRPLENCVFAQVQGIRAAIAAGKDVLHLWPAIYLS